MNDIDRKLRADSFWGILVAVRFRMFVVPSYISPKDRVSVFQSSVNCDLLEMTDAAFVKYTSRHMLRNKQLQLF